MSTDQKSESLEHLVKEVEPEDFKCKFLINPNI